jgi:hypothetical protein
MKSRRRKKRKLRITLKRGRKTRRREWKCLKILNNWEIKNNLFWQATKNTSRSLKFSQTLKSPSYPNRRLINQNLVFCTSSWESVVSTVTASFLNAIQISTSGLIFCRLSPPSCQIKTLKLEVFALKQSQICFARMTMDYLSSNLTFSRRFTKFWRLRTTLIWM